MNPGPEDNVEEKGGKRGGPKKLFKWNEEIRSDIKITRLFEMFSYFTITYERIRLLESENGDRGERSNPLQCTSHHFHFV